MRLLLVASSGGHLRQLLFLRDFWGRYPRAWVTFDTPDARAALAGEHWYGAHFPTNRSTVNLARNTALAARILRHERPDVIVTTGAGVGVPFCWLARAWGARSVWIETFDRVSAPSLSARLVAPVVDVFVVQREAQRHFHPRAVVLGPVA